MATPRVSENPTTQRQYVTQLAISAALGQAIRTLWTSLNPTSTEAAWDAFRAATHAVVPQYAQAASVTSLDNYRVARVEAGIKTVPRLPMITAPPASKIDAGMDWAKRLDGEAAAQAKMLAEVESRILGRVDAAMQKVLMDEARETVVAAVEGDDKALGFRRVARPDACYWCVAQAIRKSTRGPGDDEHWGVYKSRASAGQIPPNAKGDTNRFHNSCHCTVEPIFSTDFAVPAWLQDMSSLYGRGDGMNDFRRALNAQRGGDVTPPDPLPVLPTPAIQPAAVNPLADLLTRLAADGARPTAA